MSTTSTVIDTAQRRASTAWKMVSTTSPEIKYRELIKGVPAMINSGGLLATLAYLNTRTGSNKTAATKAFDHLTTWLIETDLANAHDDLFEQLAAADTATLRQQTEECFALLMWLRRFADVQHAGEKS